MISAPVKEEADGLIDDVEFDHSSFLSLMSHEKDDTIQIREGISMPFCNAYGFKTPRNEILIEKQ